MLGSLLSTLMGLDLSRIRSFCAPDSHLVDQIVALRENGADFLEHARTIIHSSPHSEMNINEELVRRKLPPLRSEVRRVEDSIENLEEAAVRLADEAVIDVSEEHNVALAETAFNIEPLRLMPGENGESRVILSFKVALLREAFMNAMEALERQIRDYLEGRHGFCRDGVEQMFHAAYRSARKLSSNPEIDRLRSSCAEATRRKRTLERRLSDFDATSSDAGGWREYFLLNGSLYALCEFYHTFPAEPRGRDRRPKLAVQRDLRMARDAFDRLASQIGDPLP